MIQRDKIMENLMYKKKNSDFFIDKTTSIRTDETGKVISSQDRYRVSPSLPNETDKNAIKLETELNAGKNVSIFDMDFSNTSPWDEVWENIDIFWNLYLKEKQKDRGGRIPDSTLKGYNSSYNYLKLFCVKGVTPNLRYYKKIQNYMELLPNNFLRSKKWANTTFEDIENNFDNCDYPTLDAQTINKHLNIHKQFFQFLEADYEHPDDENFDNTVYQTDMYKLKKLFEEDKEDEIRNPYSAQDLINIFKSDYLDKEKREFLLVSLFTGLRVSELSSVTSKNIIDNCIKIFKGKSKAAKRIVPIHNEIKNIISQRLNNKNEYLFFNGNASANGKKLNRILHKIIEDDEDKTLHSLRKNFSIAMENTNVGEEKYKTYLFGHSISSVRHKKYNKYKVNIDKLREIINAIEIKYS